MGNYTPERAVGEFFNRLSQNFSSEHMDLISELWKSSGLAATLRQQAGTVDALCDAVMGGLLSKQITRHELRDALTAALAQSTQEDGEAVAFRWHEASGITSDWCSMTIASLHDAARALGHRIEYAYAERARVPDVDAMVSRFLGWTLPKDFAPDAGISFKPIPNLHGNPYPWPTGTNLLHADQAKAMFEYVLAAPSQRAEVK